MAERWWPGLLRLSALLLAENARVASTVVRQAVRRSLAVVRPVAGKDCVASTAACAALRFRATVRPAAGKVRAARGFAARAWAVRVARLRGAVVRVSAENVGVLRDSVVRALGGQVERLSRWGFGGRP